MSELVQITRRTTRRFNARGHMMVALFEGVHRVVTMLARALRALASRLTFRRNRALAP